MEARLDTKRVRFSSNVKASYVPSRPLSAVALICCAGSRCRCWASSPLAGARTSDRSQPMDVEADQQRLLDQRRPASACSPATCTSRRARWSSRPAKRGGASRQRRHPPRPVLTGSPAKLKQELDDGSTIKARAQNVDYDMATDTVVLTGDALIDQPGARQHHRRAHRVQHEDPARCRARRRTATSGRVHDAVPAHEQQGSR